MADPGPAKTQWMPYGGLNDVNKPVAAPRIDLQQDSIIGVVRNMVTAEYTPNAILGTGPYKGICLRVEKETAPPGTWLTKALSFISGESPRVLIKVRIPEIHAMIPIPKTVGDEKDLESQSIIDMYPTFIAQSNDRSVSPEPQLNALVWVDYGNKQNQTDPIYIRPVDTAGNTPVGNGDINPRSSHAAACVGTLNSIRPPGDALAGQNKALSHSGLPLLPRKSNLSVSGNSEIIKGAKFSARKLQQWETAIAKSVPGKTWFGVMNSNGLEDPKHKEGHRCTIIFAPNTTDFSAPIELMYFFHGLNEFGNGHDFSNRFAPAIQKLSASNRNFVLVIPELPWCKDVAPGVVRRECRLSKRDNFANLHREVSVILKEYFSQKANIGFVSLTAHSSGIGAMSAAATSGALDAVKPQKITYADASFAPGINLVWEKYVQNNNVEYNLLIGNMADQGAARNARELLKKTKSSKITIEEIQGKTHPQIGDMGLCYVNQKYKNGLNAIRDAQASETGNISDEEIDKIEPMSRADNETQKAKDPDKTLKQPGVKSPPPTPNSGNVSASAVAKSSGTKKQSSAIIKPATQFQEARVRVSDYYSLEGNDLLLVSVPGTGGAKIHKLVKARWVAMNNAWKKDNPHTQDLLVGSGWRAKQTMSEEAWTAKWMATGKYSTVENLRKARAYHSAHETGMAVDFTCNGIRAGDLSTNQQQKQTACYKWLVENAHKYGFTPYIYEAWHWECRLPFENWKTGEEFVTDGNYALRIEYPGEKSGVPMAGGNPNQPCVAQMGAYQGSNVK